MLKQIIRAYISSTWLDLIPERASVEVLLQKFRETKFIGMEYFGSCDETTKQASLSEIDMCDLYICIVGGRYGSGITEAEYDKARIKKLPCLIYFKEDAAIQPEGRDLEQTKTEHLKKFKEKLLDPISGHTVTEFSGCQELASRLAGDLHNWLFDHYLAPALSDVASGKTPLKQASALNSDIKRLAAINNELLAKMAEEKRLIDKQRRIALQAFYQLTYVVPDILSRFPDTAPEREHVVRENLKQLTLLNKLSKGAHDVLRELATNYRLLATIFMEQNKLRQACNAFRKSAAHCDSLIKLQSNQALYHRDRAASHLNIGIILESQGNYSGALEEYLTGLVSASRAAELDSFWLDIENDARNMIKQVKSR
jgi:hypothetical protein